MRPYLKEWSPPPPNKQTKAKLDDANLLRMYVIKKGMGWISVSYLPFLGETLVPNMIVLIGGIGDD